MRGVVELGVVLGGLCVRVVLLLENKFEYLCSVNCGFGVVLGILLYLFFIVVL